MILADTSIWVDHLRYLDLQLVSIIRDDRLLCHPFIVGELALGSLKHRRRTLDDLKSQRMCAIASEPEVIEMIERHELHSMGIGYIDAHLIASALLDGRAALWTRDRRLRQAAAKAGASLYEPPAVGH